MSMYKKGFPTDEEIDYKEVKTWIDFLKKAEGKLIVFGCGGHARSVISAVRGQSSEIEIILVDYGADTKEVILGCKAVHEYEIEENDRYIMALGDNQRRRELYHWVLGKSRGMCISIVAKQAIIGMDVKVDRGTFIAPGAYIGPQAEIGCNSVVNTGSIVEHETIIGNHTHIAPGATICGRCRVGDNVFCGAGSTVVDKVSICDNVVIGAGAVVVADIHEAGTYVGVPVRKVK